MDAGLTCAFLRQVYIIILRVNLNMVLSIFGV
jgi:hypothetical protein